MTDPINLERVASLVGNHEDITATPREREIAAKVRKIGERMEREGYLPSIRRDRMMRVLRDEAVASAGGTELPLCECGSTKVSDERGNAEMVCAKCGSPWMRAERL